jgi:hypothetical protein
MNFWIPLRSFSWFLMWNMLFLSWSTGKKIVKHGFVGFLPVAQIGTQMDFTSARSTHERASYCNSWISRGTITIGGNHEGVCVKPEPARRAAFCKNRETHLKLDGPYTSFQVSTVSRFSPDIFSDSAWAIMQIDGKNARRSWTYSLTKSRWKILKKVNNN